MHRALVSLLVALPLLAACAQGSQPAAQGQAPAVVPAAPASATLAIRDGAGAQAPFRLASLEKLALEVQVASVAPGAHDVRIDVMSPRGTLYAQLPAKVEADAAGQAGATQDIQVQGTSIESFHQTGTWTFTVSLDGGATLATAQAEVAE
jgi:hypothetical protein